MVTSKPSDTKVEKSITSFVYTSETPRVYLDRGLEVHRGDVIEWPDGAPDVHWTENDSKES